MPLGDVLLAELVNDPESAGRPVAEVIADTEAGGDRGPARAVVNPRPSADREKRDGAQTQGAG